MWSDTVLWDSESKERLDNVRVLRRGVHHSGYNCVARIYTWRISEMYGEPFRLEILFSHIKKAGRGATTHTPLEPR